MESITSADLEHGIDGQRDGKDRPGKEADEESCGIEKNRAAMVFHRGSGAGEVVFEEEAAEKFAVGGDADGPIPREGDSGGGEDGGEGAHGPASFEEMERIECRERGTPKRT